MVFRQAAKFAILVVLISGCARSGGLHTSPKSQAPGGNKQDFQLKDMAVGDCGWTTPWALYRDAHDQYWLRASYSCQPFPGGTVQLLVHRMADGYRVDISSQPNYRWNKGTETPLPGDLLVVAVTASGADGRVRTSTQLPAEHFQKELRDLQIGESAWTTPWALYRGESGRYFLNGSYAASQTGRGTARMLVTCGANGFTVDVTATDDYRWSKYGAAFVGDFQPIEVCEIVARSENGEVLRGTELPPYLFQKALMDLKVGEQAWTMPWALYATTAGNYRLHGHYSAHQSALGTARMLVIRTEHGWDVDISACRSDETWSTRSARVGEFEPLPVRTVRGGRIKLAK